MTKRKTKSEKEEGRIARSRAPTVSRAMRKGVTIYTPEVINEVINRVAHGETLTSVCNDERMPTWGTVHRWCDEHEEFAAQLVRARALGKQYNLDYVIDIADEAEDIPHAKVQIEARWKVIERDDLEQDRAEKKKIDPKLIEAIQQPEGQWKVLENGERANSMEQLLDRYLNPAPVIK